MCASSCEAMMKKGREILSWDDKNWWCWLCWFLQTRLQSCKCCASLSWINPRVWSMDESKWACRRYYHAFMSMSSSFIDSWRKKLPLLDPQAFATPSISPFQHRMGLFDSADGCDFLQSTKEYRAIWFVSYLWQWYPWPWRHSTRRTHGVEYSFDRMNVSNNENHVNETCMHIHTMKFTYFIIHVCTNVQGQFVSNLYLSSGVCVNCWHIPNGDHIHKRACVCVCVCIKWIFFSLPRCMW